MIIICSSKKPGDVINGLIAAKKQNIKVTGIFQVGDKLYYKLRNNQQLIQSYWNKRPRNYKINLNTRRIHRKECKSMSGVLIEASIINVSRAGLRKCKRCLKRNYMMR